MSLDFICRKSFRGPSEKIVVFLHGYGADGHDLIDLGASWEPSLGATEFLSVHAPFPCEEAPFGRQWFSLRNREPAFLQAGLQEALPRLQTFLDEALLERELSDQDLCLVGFSQGAMMALSCAVSRPKACAGVLGYSGAYVSSFTKAESQPPIFLVHGQEDEVVPFSAMTAAKDRLEGLGVSVKTLARPGLAHGIDPEGLLQGGHFIKSCLKR